jgi:uncharacterized protein YndB with AHSA1/START domain
MSSDPKNDLVIDPALDLKLERFVEVPVRLVWAAWTEPEHLKKWFCPKPWQTVHCEIDLWPGGKFRTVMRGPDGTEMDNTGCFLEVVPERRLVWTGLLEPGFRPHRKTSGLPFVFTARLLFEPQGSGTKYTAIAMHRDPDAAKRHDQMGFTAGWGKALEQMVEAIQQGSIR